MSWMRGVKSLLQKTKHKIILCWISSHCDTYGNEKADRLADKGAKIDQRNIPVTFSIAKAKIRKCKVEANT